MKKDTQHKNTVAAKVARIKQKAAEHYSKTVAYCVCELIERHYLEGSWIPKEEYYIQNDAGDPFPIKQYVSNREYKELAKQVMSACKRLGINVFALRTGIYLSHFGNDLIFDYDIISTRLFDIKHKWESWYDPEGFAYIKPRRRHRNHKIPNKNVPPLVKWRLNT